MLEVLRLVSYIWIHRRGQGLWCPVLSPFIARCKNDDIRFPEIICGCSFDVIPRIVAYVQSSMDDWSRIEPPLGWYPYKFLTFHVYVVAKRGASLQNVISMMSISSGVTSSRFAPFNGVYLLNSYLRLQMPWCTSCMATLSTRFCQVTMKVIWLPFLETLTIGIWGIFNFQKALMCTQVFLSFVWAFSRFHGLCEPAHDKVCPVFGLGFQGLDAYQAVNQINIWVAGLEVMGTEIWWESSL